MIDPTRNDVSFVHRLDSRAKIIPVFAGIILLVLTPPHAIVRIGFTLLLVLLFAAIARLRPGEILRRAAMALPFVLLMGAFLPFMHGGRDLLRFDILGWPIVITESGLLAFWNVMAKAIISVLALAVLAATTEFPELVRGLRRLRLPSILLTLTAFTHRYLAVLVGEARHMLMAVSMRGAGLRWTITVRAMGGVVGILFIRTFERAERIYLSMALRGYRDAMPVLDPHQPHRADGVFLAISLVAIATLHLVGWLL